LRIVQLTPGAGKMYCGACLRDNALVAALRRLGHSVVMAPLYLPLTLEERDQSDGAPIFYNGVNVFLDQHSGLFRNAPRWLHNIAGSRTLLNWVARYAASTKPAKLGEMTISMLQGEEGRQARELDPLLEWLRVEKPDVVCLSNALLVGMARRIKSELRVPVFCSLQGEDEFLDALPESHRQRAWQVAAQRAADVDLFIAPSKYFGDLMQKRLNLADDQVRVLYNGIHLDGYDAAPLANSPPVIGYLARMCREKGLEPLVEAFILLKQRDRIKGARLHIAGSCGPSDQPFVDRLRQRMQSAGVLADVEFHPNLSREQKQAFLRSLSVFSVPAIYSEAFGMYVIEAMAAGVPVVQPRHAAFPELLAHTGGGILCSPNDPDSLSQSLEDLLADPQRSQALARSGRRAIFENFDVNKMAADFAALCNTTPRDASLRLARAVA
jgi:glycosyltransferase involved in cell wall biosynthesis